MSYLIRCAKHAPALDAGVDSDDWKNCQVLKVKVFRPEGSDHRPETEFRLQYDDKGLYGLFTVRDRYVRCVAEHFQDSVCLDSCVEFFVQPSHGAGYLNFEFSASGVMLAQQHPDTLNPRTVFRSLTEAEVAGVQISHTLPDRIEPEMTGDIRYEVGFFLPFSIFAATNGTPVPVSRTVWRANVYKCGDKTSHPHWASWLPLQKLDFHTPFHFGDMEFE